MYNGEHICERCYADDFCTCENCGDVVHVNEAVLQTKRS